MVKMIRGCQIYLYWSFNITVKEWVVIENIDKFGKSRVGVLQNYVEFLKNSLYFRPPTPLQIHSDAVPLSFIEYVEHGGGGYRFPDPSSLALSNVESWISACIYTCTVYVGVSSANNTQISRPCNSMVVVHSAKIICKNIYLAYDETL